ncbi:MAG: hypothetical protein M3083_00830 [Actinomycetota bacterium]|nr:hypothetical protein [Actinomycetota bacterium]
MAEVGDLVLSALGFEAMIDDYGWDQLPSLWALDTEPDLDTAVPSRGDVWLAYRRLGEGEPYELLAGVDAAGADGLLLAWEGWDWPPDATPEERRRPPSAHPDRREVRMVILAARDGRLVSVARQRGMEPEAFVDEGAGPLLDALQAALERSRPPDPNG